MATLQNPSNVSDMKVCFVTTGATAPFTGLIESVLQPSSIDALNAEGYTHLLIQYGSAKQIMEQNAQEARERIQGLSGTNLIIDGFDFNQEGLKEQFKMVQQSNGLVISHAGIFQFAMTSADGSLECYNLTRTRLRFNSRSSTLSDPSHRGPEYTAA